MSKVSKEEEKQLRISANVHAVPTKKTHKSANIPIAAYIVFVLILIVGLVGTAKTLGWYGTSGKVSADGQAIVLSVTTTGDELKGWMSLDSFLQAYSITEDEFRVEFKITSELSTSTTLGELGEITSEAVSVEVLRLWVDAGHKLGTVLPGELATSASSSASPSSAPSPVASGTGEGTPSSTDENGDFIIKGRTTIQEVLDETKVSKSSFYLQFNLPESIPTSTALSAIKESVPDFEITLIQDWYAAR
jgi:hypothetical protein